MEHGRLGRATVFVLLACLLLVVPFASAALFKHGAFSRARVSYAVPKHKVNYLESQWLVHTRRVGAGVGAVSCVGVEQGHSQESAQRPHERYS